MHTNQHTNMARHLVFVSAKLRVNIYLTLILWLGITSRLNAVIMNEIQYVCYVTCCVKQKTYIFRSIGLMSFPTLEERG